MKIIIFGAGKMGIAIAKLSLSEERVKQLVLVDTNEKKLKESVRELHKLFKNRLIVATSPIELDKYIEEIDLIICAIPWSEHKNIIDLSVKYNKPLVSISRPEHTELSTVRELVKNVKAPLIFGCGLEPGLTEIMALHLANKFNKLDELHIKCGSIPLKPPYNPLRHKAMFGSNYLPIGVRDVFTYKTGRLQKVQRFSGLEEFYLAKVGKLEAWNDGMVPWLCEYPIINSVDTMTQKTLRWPGHAKAVLMLHKLGLLSEQEISIDKKLLSAKKFIDHWYSTDTELAPNESNITILSIIANGEYKNGNHCTKKIYLSVRENHPLKLNSLAWLTAYIAIYIGLIAVETFSNKYGLFYPEQFINGSQVDLLIEKLGPYIDFLNG